MNLGTAPPRYDPLAEARMRRDVEKADGENHKRGRTIEVGPGAAVVLTDSVTGDRYALTVASGAIALLGPL